MIPTEHPFHLPALSERRHSADIEMPPTGGGQTPELTPELIVLQIRSLIHARREHLIERPVMEIVEVIDHIAGRFLTPSDELRKSAIDGVVGSSGLSAAMANRVLDGMAVDWLAEPLRRTLLTEFGEPEVLDGFVLEAAPDGSAGRMIRAYGPELTLHVFSGNVPGVAVTSLIRALLVKSASFGKTGSGEPNLAPLFARAVAEADGDLGRCLAVAGWPGGDEALESPLLARADAVIVYGGDHTVEAIRNRIPARTHFHAYPHRFSLGVATREALTAESARRIAADAAEAAAMFDQQGCTSPHVFYMEEGGEVTPGEWAEMLAAEMQEVERRLPRGRIEPGESAAILQARGETEIAQLAGLGHRLHMAATGTEWTVIFDPDPGFIPSCLNRTVRVKPIASADEVPGLLAPLGSALQTVGIEATMERRRPLAARLGEIGATRITSISRMPWPPATWHHDGRPPLSSLVRWCDLEDDGSAASDGTPLAPRAPHDQ